jgi:hypothetical protein
MHRLFVVVLVCFVCGQHSWSQQSDVFHGQMAGWLLYNPSNRSSFTTGGLFIPQINGKLGRLGKGNLDIEASVKLDGYTGLDSTIFDNGSAHLKPYRLWARVSASQWEARLGLQKINFGSAMMLRPLMWFDKVDPRDPLQLTNGVWGALGRYYFVNNTNIWLWTLHGNGEPKTWEMGATNPSFPEIGARLQLPVPKGEIGLSYHFRQCERDSLWENSLPSIMPENRLGFDAKYDVEIGLWAEAAWIHKGYDIGLFTNQQLLTLGADYTFGVGNGINVVGEHMMGFYGQTAFVADESFHVTALSVNYPLGMFANLSVMVYTDWSSGKLYNFVNLKRSFGNLSAYIMAFKNPDTMVLPTQMASQNLFAGAGCQVMAVYHF